MTRSLTLERLDSKVLLNGSGTGMPFGITLNAFGVLQIKGDGRDDAAQVWVADGQVHAKMTHTSWVQGLPLTVPGPEKAFALAQVKSVFFIGEDGNDSFTNDTSLKCTAFGRGGNDVLVGGSAADLLIGGDGADTLEGRQGADDLRGSAGSDTYTFNSPGLSWVGLGSDTIQEDANADSDKLDFSGLAKGVTVNLGTTAAQAVKSSGLSLTFSSALGVENVTGTPAADTVTGNGRPNQVVGQSGNDTVVGNAGADVLFGGDGNDVLYGNAGDDALHGGADNDKLYPGGDANTVTDGTGHDLVDFHLNAFGVTYTTGGGNDTIIGSLFDDKITGSTGHDRFEGGVGDDTLTGASGNDVLVGGHGINTLSDGLGNDTVDFSLNAVGVTYTTGGGNDVIIGTDQDDVLTGSSGDDKLYGGSGCDRLIGKAGNDELFGQDGDDWLEAGSAAEWADGGAGTDYNAFQPAGGGATYADVKQAGAGTCVFLSALAGAARQGMDLASRITYLGDYMFNVKLYNAESGTSYNQQVKFDGTISHIDGKRWDPKQASPEEFWTILYQRAYLAMTKAVDVDFKDPEFATHAVTGRAVVNGDWDDPTVLKNAIWAGQVVTAGQADDTHKIYSNHSYTVMNVYQENGHWMIQLRNPWGHDVEGNKTPYGTNSDGLIVMKYSSFQGYHDFDRISIS